MKFPPAPIALFLAAFFLGGAFLDFLLSGVFKIIWAVVYIPAYIVAAKVVISKLSHTRYEKISGRAALILVAGALVSHLIFMNSSRSIVYSMQIVSSEPLTLASKDWPQKLLVSSDHLGQLTQGLGQNAVVPVNITVVADYGCHLRSTVDSISGVQIESDPDARWTWKIDSHQDAPTRGPGYEDYARPWCRIHFYRRS